MFCKFSTPLFFYHSGNSPLILTRVITEFGIYKNRHPLPRTVSQTLNEAIFSLCRSNRLGRFCLMAWRVRPSEQNHNLCAFKRVGPSRAINWWPTRAIHSSLSLSRRGSSRRRITVSAIHRSAVAVRFSRSAVFFINEFLETIWPLIEIHRSLVGAPYTSTPDTAHLHWWWLPVSLRSRRSIRGKSQTTDQNVDKQADVFTSQRYVSTVYAMAPSVCVCLSACHMSVFY